MKMHDVSNVVLIGMPGAGKSTLGVVLAKILNKGFLDCDLLIQRQFDKTLQQLIDEQGVEGFIALEGRVLEGIETTDQVIATGGSAVYSSAAMRHLAQLGPVVYLRVTLESLMARLDDLHERGVVMRGGLKGSCGDAAAATAAAATTAAATAAVATTTSAALANAANTSSHKVLEELYQERYHLYEHFADIIVDVDNLAISDAALKVAAALQSVYGQCSAANGAADNDARGAAGNTAGSAAHHVVSE